MAAPVARVTMTAVKTTVEIANGRVLCPVARDPVDVEECYRCAHLRAFYDEESGTRVVCALAPHLHAPALPHLHRGLRHSRV